MRRCSFGVLPCAFAVAIACGELANVRAAPPKIESALITLIEESEVPAREAGVVSRIVVREGQTVKAGDLLAQIADDQAQLDRKRAELEHDIARRKAENDVSVRFAKKSLAVAKAELRRANESVERYKRSVSQTELDRLRLVVERTTLEIEQAETDLKIAESTRLLKQNELEAAVLKVQRRKVVAPISGVVVEINRRLGEWVEPGEKVARIVRIDRLRVQGFIDANSATNNLQGSSVTVTVDLAGSRGAKFPGKIVFVSPEIDPVNKQVQVWAEIENRGLSLRPGLRATMTIGTTPNRPRSSPRK